MTRKKKPTSKISSPAASLPSKKEKSQPSKAAPASRSAKAKRPC